MDRVFNVFGFSWKLKFVDFDYVFNKNDFI